MGETNEEYVQQHRFSTRLTDRRNMSSRDYDVCGLQLLTVKQTFER